jgi:tetratricopeptide (TPR) repeat protein
MKLQDFDTAYKQADDAKKIYSDYGDELGEARSLTQIGMVLNEMNREQDAIPVLEKAIKIFQAKNNVQGRAEALQLLGIIYTGIDSNKAIQHLEQSRELYREIIGDNENLKPILDNLDQRINQLQDGSD